jgi:16S rRNA (uracil1498-N3)-methyltransferase
MTMRRFYAPPDSFAGRTVILGEGETRHLRDVLRLSVGDVARVFDGGGGEFECKIETIEKRRTILSVADQVEPTCPESQLEIEVAAAVLPPEKFDLVVHKVVELGAARLQPLITARTEIRAGPVIKRVDRWRKIVIEASKQCGRATLMEVAEPMKFESFVKQLHGEALVFSEREGSAFSDLAISNSATLMFGPKGGWTDEELDLAAASKATIITFGGRILKAETAAIAITAIIQHRFGDMN